MKRDHLAAESFLPLTPSMYHILLALGGGAGHGYGIMKLIEERTGGRLKLGPGNLYGSIKRLLEGGLIQEERNSDQEPSASATPGPGRRYYQLTSLGRQVARMESRRLAELVDWARSSRLLEEQES